MEKVLFLVNHDVVIYNLRKELVEKLIQNGYDVIISSPYGERIELLKQMGCHYVEAEIDRHGTNPLTEIRLISYYRKLITEVRPRVVLSFSIKPNVYGGMVCASHGVPYMANITGLGLAIENKGSLRKILMSMYRFGLRKATCVFFQNESNMNCFEDGKIVKGYTRLLPGSGVNTDEHCFEVYPYFGQNEDTFLFIGRITKDKGIEEFLEAAKTIKEEFPKTRFDIVGACDEDYTSQLSKLENDGIIKYWGQQLVVHDFIKKCSALVLPSYHEGMANVLLEASSTGRPVLASDIPGCRETFDEGDSGFGFEPQSADDLCATIRKFILLDHEKKAAMGKRARDKVVREFDRNIVVDAYMEEIKKLGDN